MPCAAGMMRPPGPHPDEPHAQPARCDRLLVANPFRWMPRVLATPLLDRDVPFPSSRADVGCTGRCGCGAIRSDSTSADVAEPSIADYDRSLRRAARPARHGASRTC